MPKKKETRGRKKKRVIPTTLPAAMSLQDAQLAMVEQCKTYLAAKKNPPNHLARALRDAWLLENSLHLWPSLEAAAAELGVSPSTVRGFKQDGCPGLEEGHSPIPKAPVLSWLLKRAHERGAAPSGNKENMEEVELRFKMAKTYKIERTLIAEAEDLARQGVVTLVGKMRHHLLHVLPGQIYDLTCPADRPAPDKLSAEDLVAKLIGKALDDFKRLPLSAEPTATLISSPPPTLTEPS